MAALKFGFDGWLLAGDDDDKFARTRSWPERASLSFNAPASACTRHCLYRRVLFLKDYIM